MNESTAERGDVQPFDAPQRRTSRRLAVLARKVRQKARILDPNGSEELQALASRGIYKVTDIDKEVSLRVHVDRYLALQWARALRDKPGSDTGNAAVPVWLDDLACARHILDRAFSARGVKLLDAVLAIAAPFRGCDEIGEFVNLQDVARAMGLQPTRLTHKDRTARMYAGKTLDDLHSLIAVLAAVEVTLKAPVEKYAKFAAREDDDLDEKERKGYRNFLLGPEFSDPSRPNKFWSSVHPVLLDDVGAGFHEDDALFYAVVPGEAVDLHARRYALLSEIMARFGSRRGSVAVPLATLLAATGRGTAKPARARARLIDALEELRERGFLASFAVDEGRLATAHVRLQRGPLLSRRRCRARNETGRKPSQTDGT